MSSKISHILGHDANLTRYRKAEIILPAHRGIKLEINSKRNYVIYMIIGRLDNTVLSDDWAIE